MKIRSVKCLRPLFVLVFLLSILLVITGCSQEDDNVPRRLVDTQQNSIRVAQAGEIFQESLIIRVLNEDGTVVPDTELTVKPAKDSFLEAKTESQEDGEFSTFQKVKTNEVGEIRLKVRAGKKNGDQFLTIQSVTNPDIRLSVRFIIGLSISGMKQEAKAGKPLPEPFRVRLTDEDGKPEPGVPVAFSMINMQTGSELLEHTEILTDQDGTAEIQPVMADETGTSNLFVRIQKENFDTLAIPEMTMNLPVLLIHIFGGLALFVFGMKLMSDGLRIAAGEKMRSILQLFSSNRFIAVLAGLLVTTVLQSSSASTVMVIGFVNAGLLTLVQSIGIIFGANIGKAVVTQLVAFDLSSIIMPCIITGIVLMFVSWQKLRGWSETVLGFGLLFMGMSIMSSELKPLRTFPSFVNFFSKFNCTPVNGSIPFFAFLGAIAIGILVTLVVQSSFPTTGIVIALCLSGLLDIYAGVAIVLGANVGTTITAQLASIPANRVAKQAALAHTMFNVLGILFLLPFFWIKLPNSDLPLYLQFLDWVTPGDAFATVPQNVAHYIANAHMFFNIITTIVLFSFAPLLAKLCAKIIPLGEKKIKFTNLEPHLLNTPALALEQTGISIRKMLKRACKMIELASAKCFIPGIAEEEEITKLTKREEKVNTMQIEISAYLTQIMSRHLNRPQAAVIPLLMHCTHDAERIANHAKNIIFLTKRLEESGGKISEAATQELSRLYDLLKEQGTHTLGTLVRWNKDDAAIALGAEAKINRLAKEFENNHIRRLGQQQCNPITGFVFIEFISELTKVSEHLTHIAQRSAKISGRYTEIAAELHKRTVSETRSGQNKNKTDDVSDGDLQDE